MSVELDDPGGGGGYRGGGAGSGSEGQVYVAQLGVPLPIAYGYVRARGNQLFRYQNPSTKAWVAFFILGEGEWDGIERLWVNRVIVDHTDTSKYHFHPGKDSVIGDGMSAVSTGSDQKVDAFFTSLPANVEKVTLNRKAYLAISVPADPASPTAELDVVGDYRTTKCRRYDNVGAFVDRVFTTNGAWQALDLLIRSYIKRESLVDVALDATEKLRFDWPSWKDTADYCDGSITGAADRFVSSVAFPNVVTEAQALEQLQLISRFFIHEDGGKIYCRADKSRAYSFTMKADHIIAGTFKVVKPNIKGAANRFIGSYNDLDIAKISSIDGWSLTANVVTVTTLATHPFLTNDGIVIQDAAVGGGGVNINGRHIVTSTPSGLTFTFAKTASNDSSTTDVGIVGMDEQRFTARQRIVDHEEHQKAIGARGAGLAIMRKRIPGVLQFGNCTGHQVDRILHFLKWRGLGLDAENGAYAAPYRAPWEITVEALMEAVDAGDNALLAQLPGDIIKIDASISEEFKGDYELLEEEIRWEEEPGKASTIELRLKEYIPDAFTDTAQSQQPLSVIRPAEGLDPVTIVQSNGIQTVKQANQNQTATAGRNSAVRGSTPLSAADVGTTTTITIAAFTMQYGFGTKAYNSGSITGLGFSTKYYVFVEDPLFEGGTKTFYAATTYEDGIVTEGRAFVDYITTPADGGGGTGGGGEGGGCPDVEMYLTAILRALDAKPGEEIDCHVRGELLRERIQRVAPHYAPCFLVRSRSGAECILSAETYVETEDGRNVYVPNMSGAKTLVEQNDGAWAWEEVEVAYVGFREVKNIFVGGKSYAAGREPRRRMMAHNVKGF